MSLTRPMVNRDSQFFWDGTAVGELRIQSCNACASLRFPPGPTCPDCGAQKTAEERRVRQREGRLVEHDGA
ncbi:MAG: hypothetical protein KKA97_10065, partial [Actinobacteria bacterium]|nr:hypothetical protein [Actinomycetota bacterium]